MKNFVVIAGIETQRDSMGNVKKLSETFLNNAMTFEKDYPNDNVVIIDCQRYIFEEHPINAMWADVASAFGASSHNGLSCIDGLFYNGHSSPDMLFAFSKVRTELPNSARYLDKNFKFIAPYNPGCLIYLLGCQAAGRDGIITKDSIAQTIANKTSCTVLAYTSRTSQQKRLDGGFVQVPERGGLVKILPF
jgi:hypothetical protein